ncbi:MAG: methyltransferase family protein [Candidatus Heimdallarchaeaceae archaeon]
MLAETMIEKFKKIFTSRIMKSLVIVMTLVWVYAPIIANILLLMAVWMVPIAFTSWILFTYFGSAGWLYKLIVLKYMTNTPGVITLLVFEAIFFTFGLVLFIWGLIYIAKVRIKKEGLATGGPYKFIRHPQHLGLILMSFSLSLYVPGTEDRGIVVGEILSWSLFALILFIWSYYEERNLVKAFGDEYLQYRSSTGSFFPKIKNKKMTRKSFNEIKYWKRNLFIFLGYICFILIIALLTYILGLPGIEIVKNY